MKNKICLAQLNSIIADVEYNKKQAVKLIENMTKSDVGLVIFPELYLSSTPLGDIPERYPNMLTECEKALDEICAVSEGISVLIGYPKKDESGYKSSVCYIKNKKIKKIITKSQECTEERIIKFNNQNLGIFVGDEIFNLNTKDLSGIDVIINPASFITRCDTDELIHNSLKEISKEYAKNLIYVNYAGANDECIFEGAGRMYDKNGNIVAFGEIFKEDNLIIDLKNGGKINEIPFWFNKKRNKNFTLDYEYDLERTYRASVFSIKEYFSKNGFERAVLGLSGGLDSSVCAVLLADALGKENVLGVSMPSKITSSDSKNDAETLAKNLGIHFFEIPIKEMQNSFNDGLNKLFKNVNWCEKYTLSYTQDNIQARSRATILWGISNEYLKTLPIATSDKSESYMGYATINGDMSGGYAPVADITKTKLFALARWMNKNRTVKNAIPENVITKPPGAELAINADTGKTLTAEEALMPYEFLDEVIWRIENFNQTINDMTESEFLYETKNSLSKEQKIVWLQKFALRLNRALYKWSISAPSPVMDVHSINKAEFRQPITSNVNL